MGWILRVFLLGAVVLVPATAEAGWITGLTGNSKFDQNNRTGFINFATYFNPVGSNWITDLSLTAGDVNTLDGTTIIGNGAKERHVFFFQYTRTESSGDNSLRDVDGLVSPYQDGWESAGYITDTVFVDGVGNVVGNDAGTNYTIGDEATNGTSGKVTGEPGPTFATLAAAIDPTAADVNAGTTGEWAFDSPKILQGEFSSVFFFTTASTDITIDDGFTNFVTGTVAGGSGATLDLPASNPEPGSMLLMSLAMLGGVWQVRRRRREQAEPA